MTDLVGGRRIRLEIRAIGGEAVVEHRRNRRAIVGSRLLLHDGGELHHIVEAHVAALRVRQVKRGCLGFELVEHHANDRRRIVDRRHRVGLREEKALERIRSRGLEEGVVSRVHARVRRRPRN